MSKDNRRYGPRVRRCIPTAVLALGALGVLGPLGANTAALAPALAAASGPAPTAPSLLVRVEQAARAHGVDPARMLRSTLHLSEPAPGGGTTTVALTVAQAIADAAPGLPGLPDVNVGDVVHFYVNYGSGSALAYNVTQVPVVPATPPAFVPPVGPVPPVYDMGGSVVNVTGSGYKTGEHTVGNFGVGSNVDTAPGAPSPFPAWLPVLTGGSVVSDTAIDFTGHALVTQDQACLFGFCVAVGALVGDGATLFNQPPPVTLPPVAAP
ncbi:MAG: hypothetical protein ACYCZM_14785 [Acidimicrobiales bacterium]